jgi:hypothetical protein
VPFLLSLGSFNVILIKAGFFSLIRHSSVLAQTSCVWLCKFKRLFCPDHDSSQDGDEYDLENEKQSSGKAK